MEVYDRSKISAYVGVQKNLKYVEKYFKSESWELLTQQSFIEIKKHIAPNISGLIDLESARFFDLLCYKFAATKFHKNNTFSATAKSIYAIASYLLNNKMHISDVEARRETLEYVVTYEFLTDTTVTHMDNIRGDLCELMRYIEKIIIDPIISDFDDRIDKTNDADDEPVDFTVTVDDFKRFDEKVEFCITNHPNDALVYQVTHLEKTSEDAIKAFKQEIVGLAKDENDYKAVFPDDSMIPVFVRKTVGISKAAIDGFVEFEANKSFNERQLGYIKELLKFISQNGKFERNDLLREELFFGELFDSIAINSVIKDIKERL